MLVKDINLWSLFIFLLVFAIYSVKIAPSILSPYAYFHDDRPKNNVISLTAANITLGTGLIFHITGAQRNGILWFLIPICTAIGYFLLSVILPKINEASRKGKNLFFSINEQIEESTGEKSSFAKFVTLSLIVIYILIIAYEIYASSSIVAPLFFKDPTIAQQASVSFLIFVITSFYALFGGIKVVFRTDKIQILIIYFFIPILILVSIFSSTDHNFTVAINNSFKFNLKILITVFLFCIAAITTQFYSLLNWATVSHLKVENQISVFRRVGKRVLLLLSSFTLLGIILPSGQGSMILLNFSNSHVYQPIGLSIFPSLVSVLLVLGLSSILLTTIDSLIITVSMFFYDNLLKRDSKSLDDNPNELRSIRILSLIALLTAFLVLSYIHYIRPNYFMLLLVFASAVVVYAPMIVTAALLTPNGNKLKIFNQRIILAYFTFFVIVGVGGLLMLKLKPAWLPYIGALSLTLSVIFSICIYQFSKKI